MNNSDNGIAFVFPGQGSQSVGMLRELAERYREVIDTFDEASTVLKFDLWKLVSEGPAEQLNLTENTQPAMLAAGVAVWRVWQRSTNVIPGWMAGHSLGEYTALVCAGALGYTDAVALVVERARCMQNAVPAGTGAMAAILGLDDTVVVAICAKLCSEGEEVSPANFNSPGQIVIAGKAASVQLAIDAAKAEGAKRAVLLPVSVPSHCPLMLPAAERFHETLAAVSFESPTVPIIHNVDVAPHPAPEVIRAVLEKQLYGPVRWSDSVRFMYDQGAHRFIECGPGKVLTGLIKRIAAEAKVEPVFSPETLENALEII